MNPKESLKLPKIASRIESWIKLLEIKEKLILGISKCHQAEVSPNKINDSLIVRHGIIKRKKTKQTKNQTKLENLSL